MEVSAIKAGITDWQTKAAPKNRIEQLLKTIKTPNNKLRNLERTYIRRLCSMEKSKRKISMLKQYLNRWHKRIKLADYWLQRLMQNLEMHDSLQNSIRIKRARRQMKTFTVSLYLSSLRTYRMIQRSKVLCLPTKRTNKLWTSQVSFEPGLM